MTINVSKLLNAGKSVLCIIAENPELSCTIATALGFVGGIGVTKLNDSKTFNQYDEEFEIYKDEILEQDKRIQEMQEYIYSLNRLNVGK